MTKHGLYKIYHPGEREILKKEEYYIYGKLHRDNGPALAEYFIKGDTKKEEWRQHGKLHRTDGPALITYNTKKNILKEEWYIDGKLHRDDGPASKYAYRGGFHNWEGYIMKYCQHGELHRDDGPAYIEYDTCYNHPVKKKWYLNGNLHRANNKPAYMSWQFEHDHGYIPKYKIELVQWYQYGRLHRDGDKPAHRFYWDTGKVSAEKWYIDNKLHRDYPKPAVIEYNEKGEVIGKEWWDNGKGIKKEGTVYNSDSSDSSDSDMN